MPSVPDDQSVPRAVGGPAPDPGGRTRFGRARPTVSLFAAVDPSPDAVAALCRALPADVPPSLHWSEPSRWHVTLGFFGDVDEASVPWLSVALAGAVEGCRPPRLRLCGAGVFPRRGDPRVLWAGLDGATDDLLGLAYAVRAAARSARVAMDGKPPQLHLTIGRFRGARRATADPVLAALARHRGPEFDVSEVHLVRSRLGPRPEHTVVGRWPLAAAHLPGGVIQP